MIRGAITPRAAYVAYLLVVLVSAGAAYWSAHAAVAAGREDLEAVAVASAQQARESSVAGCERTKGDRQDAITGWSAARQARLRTARTAGLPQQERLAAAAAAATYRLVIRGYRSRIVDCQKAFAPVNTRAVRRFIRENAS